MHQQITASACLPVGPVYCLPSGIGSWERTEAEDMLLSLLSAAVSNLTMFKTHFTFDRYMDQTLKRFNLGAPKVCMKQASPSRL